MKRAAAEADSEREVKPRPCEHSASASCGALTATCSIADERRKAGIATGICYLDHMLDQLQAHGGLRLAVQVSLGEQQFAQHQDYCGPSHTNADPTADHRCAR